MFLIRWAIKNDLDRIVEIEQASFTKGWTEEDFINCLRQRDAIGWVAELDHEIVGFLIYELEKKAFRLVNFAVAPWVRRRGIGTRMVERLVEKMPLRGRLEILLTVRETNLRAQQFFASCGFRAIDVLRQHYDDTNEDAYEFQYRLPREAAVGR